MLRPGTKAPAITLNDQDGDPFDLASAWTQGSAVVFFYPQADTPICTKEACAFRDAFSDLRALDATVIGISRDTPAAQKAFARAHNLPFTLLSDTEGAAYKAYDVRGPLGLLPGRITYVIAAGGTVKAAHSGTLESDNHVRKALAALRGQGS